MITLSILGVVAAITVPSLINKQTEAANRTKLKKAMANYEKVLSQLVIDYDIKTDAGMTKELVTDNANCSRTTEYFKKTNKINDCIFRTADGVWWDITNIKNPIISLDKTAMTADNSTIKTKAESIESDKTSFVMVGYMEDNGSILRINDKGVASETNATYLTKLYGFASPERAGGGNVNTNPFDSSNVTIESCTELFCNITFNFNGTSVTLNGKDCDQTTKICDSLEIGGGEADLISDGNGGYTLTQYDSITPCDQTAVLEYFGYTCTSSEGNCYCSKND